MEGNIEPRKERDPQKIIVAVLVAAILVSAGVVAYLLYTRGSATAAETNPIVSGDTVTMQYTGMLADGRVFDTSLVSVAWDDILYPKSLSFSKRDNESYGPFTMTAGLYGAGGTIKGFALGVLGMYEGQTKTITIAPEDGYAIDPAKSVTVSVVQKIVATETMTDSQFRSDYGIEPIPLRVLTHYFWGWSVVIVSYEDGIVTLKHTPTVGQMVSPYGNPDDSDSPEGWHVRVDAYDPNANGGEGLTTVTNMVSASDVGEIKGVTTQGNDFFLWSFDSANQTFEVHMSDSTTGYNGEISGRTLVFEVTILLVQPAAV
jgi:FKBP-type peptidyl-prolyl cis-trans isomerase 2